MNIQTIALYERYAGVRYVLERSLEKYSPKIEIHSSDEKKEIKQFICNVDVDLLITELDIDNSDGIEISRFARFISPDIRIMWITVSGCNIYCDQRKRLGNIECFEKPLKITEFRHDVIKILENAG